MSDEEDDPVVQEVDVFLSKQLSDHLYLFQYPVRPVNMKYDDIPHLCARVKPVQQKVKHSAPESKLRSPQSSPFWFWLIWESQIPSLLL